MLRHWKAIAISLSALATTVVAAQHQTSKSRARRRWRSSLFDPKHDGGWGQAFEEARPAIEKAIGSPIPVVEKVPEDAAAITPPAERFIQRGYNVIDAFGYSDTFKKLAEAHPEVAFLNRAGITNGPNLESVLRPDLPEPISMRHGGCGSLQDR